MYNIAIAFGALGLVYGQGHETYDNGPGFPAGCKPTDEVHGGKCYAPCPSGYDRNRSDPSKCTQKCPEPLRFYAFWECSAHDLQFERFERYRFSGDREREEQLEKCEQDNPDVGCETVFGVFWVQKCPEHYHGENKFGGSGLRMMCKPNSPNRNEFDCTMEQKILHGVRTHDFDVVCNMRTRTSPGVVPRTSSFAPLCPTGFYSGDTVSGVMCYPDCLDGFSEEGSTCISNKGELPLETCGGTAARERAEGAKCRFPFAYKGVLYEQCTTAPISGNTKGLPWCYTDAGKFEPLWGNCFGTCTPPAVAPPAPQPAPQPAAPAPQPAPLPAPQPAAPAPQPAPPAPRTVEYHVVKSGNCVSNGFQFITTKAECSTAGRAVGMIRFANPSPSGNRQKYCGTWSGLEHLHFNSQTSGNLGGFPILQNAGRDVAQPGPTWQICKRQGTTGKWQATPNSAIDGHNKEHITTVSVKECKDTCVSREWCKSFDYYKQHGACDLSDKWASDVGGLKTDYAGNPFDHYSLNSDYLGGPNDSAATDLSACWGECDSDAQCKGGLKCFQRTGFTPVPGCKGLGKKDWDYCYDPAGSIALSGGNDGSAKNLQACTGECDNDAQCASGLKCFQRSSGETIPGCTGSGADGDWDYCYDPNWSATGDSSGLYRRFLVSHSCEEMGFQPILDEARCVAAVEQLGVRVASAADPNQGSIEVHHDSDERPPGCFEYTAHNDAPSKVEFNRKRDSTFTSTEWKDLYVICAEPTPKPTANPTESPTEAPTYSPTNAPTRSPTPTPSAVPTTEPTQNTMLPTASPTYEPTMLPTEGSNAFVAPTPTNLCSLFVEEDECTAFGHGCEWMGACVNVEEMLAPAGLGDGAGSA